MVKENIESNPPDLIYVERWRGLQYVPVDCRIPILCDPTDNMVLYNRRLMSSGSWWERVLGVEEYMKFLRYEPELARRANLTVFCSRVDRDCLLASHPELSCAIVPNGVDCKRFFYKSQGDAEPATIIFTGNFGYRPNVHAAVYFLETVFPIIRRRCPEARFLAVGNGAMTKLRNYIDVPAVELVDFVPELRPYLVRATVAVAPITVGVGVSNKVLEAFSVGTPVVATPLAYGDLPVRDGEHLYLANDPGSFAQKVLDLLHDSSLRARMAEQGRSLVEQKYDWEVVADQLQALMYRLAECNGPDLGPVASNSLQSTAAN